MHTVDQVNNTTQQAMYQRIWSSCKCAWYRWQGQIITYSQTFGNYLIPWCMTQNLTEQCWQHGWWLKVEISNLASKQNTNMNCAWVQTEWTKILESLHQTEATQSACLSLTLARTHWWNDWWMIRVLTDHTGDDFTDIQDRVRCHK